MTRRIWTQTAGFLATTMPVVLFTLGLVAVPSSACAPSAAAVPPAMARVTPPAAQSMAPAPLPTRCATATKGQDLVGAHAAVHETLVSLKKEAISAEAAISAYRARSLAQADSPSTMSDEEPKPGEADAAKKLEAALAAVDTEENRGNGTASDNATRIELGGDGVAYFFTGTILIEAGGGSRGWGILVLKDGCAWKRVGGDFTADALEKLRAPSGAPVLVQSYPVEPCDAETHLLMVQSAAEVQDLRIPAGRQEDFCGQTQRAELQREQGTLTGVRILSNTAEDPDQGEKWMETGSFVFERGQYIMRHATK